MPPTESDNPSGQSGLIGTIADAWDRLPVGGPTLLGGIVAVLVSVGGFIVAFSNGGTSHGRCDTTPLIHVYKPERLKVIGTCQQITVTVAAYRHEHDGDYHVNVRVDGTGWVNALNRARQHGFTVVEFVPIMPRPKRFFVGQRLRLTVTKVLDEQHGGWIEGHPVFQVQDVTPPGVKSLPNRPALAPRTEE